MATKASKINDAFLNVMTTTLTEGGANAGVVTQFSTSLTTRDKIGILIHKAELYKTTDDPFTADGDGFQWGLTQIYNSGSVPTTIIATPGIVLFKRKIRQDCGTAATINMVTDPEEHIFPEPVLVHPASLYGLLQGVSQAGALIAYLRIYYKYVDLTEADYQEILQTIIIQNAL